MLSSDQIRSVAQSCPTFCDPMNHIILYVSTLTSIHDYWKNHSFDYTDLRWQVMSLLFNMLFQFVIAFLSRSKHHLI